MPHLGNGFYHQAGGKIEVWFDVRGEHEYKPPDRTILLNGFLQDHIATAESMIDEYALGLQRRETEMTKQETAEPESPKLDRAALRVVAANVFNDLRARDTQARDANTSLINVRGKLRGLIDSINEGGDYPILEAKEICEDLLARAQRAKENGGNELRVALHEHVRQLSPIVAQLHSDLKSRSAVQ